MKSLSTVSVAAILVAGAWTVCVSADEPPPIDGTWEVSRFETATGHKFAGLKLVLKSDGETLHGKAVWPDGMETPIAAGRIAGTRVSFKVTSAGVIQDYGGEIDGGVIRGRWAASIAVFDWEARRAAADVTAEQLHGRWKFEHGALGEFATLELQRDGRFRLEHRDVALGTTTTSGTWSLKGRDVVLREERHEVDGQEVRDRTPRTEKLRIRQTADGLRLGKPRREFQRESTNREDAPETPPAAKADHPQETTQQFTGVSDKRSLDEALADALRQMDEAVAQEAKSPCSRVSWRLIEISGTSGTPAGLQTIQVKIAASFARQRREDQAAANPAGAWRVTRALGNGKFDGFTLVLWLDGEELNGTVTWADGKESGLGSGEFKNGQLSFRAGSHYTGTYEGNTIVGQWSTDIGMLEWRAERVSSSNTPDSAE
ncbi:MAG TPA: hypothetical protein VMP01_12885 [Pirellulaceae bacterium]|nr:hypothetical protein [Pirellulaceae bacterium]